MYYTHRLRSNLQEWHNRLYKSDFYTFKNYYTQFLNRLEQEQLLNLLIQDAIEAYKQTDEELDGLKEELSYGLAFENGKQAAAVLYQSLIYFGSIGYEPDGLINEFGHGQSINDRISSFVHNFIDPIVHYLHDRIDEKSFVLYLLEKYKKRTEWFKADILTKAYKEATANYEQLFEDDLRLFLFEQGIDYPFSTPKSRSGRADVVGMLDTQDPLVVEVKIYDSEKGYKKKRIIDGFKQIVEYTNNYNKTTGYLVIFNLDQIEIQIKTEATDTQFPQRVLFNNKVYYIIFVNLNNDVSASKLGTQKVEVIDEAELFQLV